MCCFLVANEAYLNELHRGHIFLTSPISQCKKLCWILLELFSPSSSWMESGARRSSENSDPGGDSNQIPVMIQWPWVLDQIPMALSLFSLSLQRPWVFSLSFQWPWIFSFVFTVVQSLLFLGRFSKLDAAKLNCELKAAASLLFPACLFAPSRDNVLKHPCIVTRKGGERGKAPYGWLMMQCEHQILPSFNFKYYCRNKLKTLENVNLRNCDRLQQFESTCSLPSP